MPRHLRRRRKLAAEIFVDVPHGVLEAADRPLGDFGRRDQFRDRGFQLMLVRLQPLQPLVEQHAVADREHQQHRHQTLDRNAKGMTHCASINLVCSSAFSNIAKVVLGLRNCLVTRMATRSPTRPMRPSVKTTLPQRTATRASDRISSGRVSTTFSFISCLSGISASYNTASTEICAWETSVAKWPSQIGSRPNFSPMNICNNTGRIGSMVA